MRILAALLLLVAAPAFADDPPVQEPPAVEEASYIGSEMCAGCHDDVAEKTAPSVHGDALADEARPESARGCEACHGAGSLHFENGGEGGILAFDEATPPDARAAPCRSCHAGVTGLHDWLGGEHALAGVTCPDCHRVHQGAHDGLLARPVPDLCYGCHADVRARFALPEHHEVNEGVLSCLDCHNPHGTKQKFELLAAHDRTCGSCHEDVTGPFIFEHASLVSEGCVACHEPHGSINRHLLRRQLVGQLCYQCHPVTPPDHLQPSFRDCTRCHVAIHGSNTDPRFLER